MTGSPENGRKQQAANKRASPTERPASASNPQPQAAAVTPAAVTTAPTVKSIAGYVPPSPGYKNRPKELGVTRRGAMGEYVPSSGNTPCSTLANPTPGPLDYDPKLPTGLQYSILGKHPPPKIAAMNCGPGPAKYNVDPTKITFDEAPHWSFRAKLKDRSKPLMDNPSPFAYNDDHGTFGKDSLKCTISGWFPMSAEETPGPDRYFPKSEFGHAPKYSFGLVARQVDDPTPGPQDYKSRFNLCQSNAAKYKFRPGCNEYYPKMSSSAKATSLKGSYKESKALKTPGPANYIMPNTLFSGPQHSLTGRNIPYEEEPTYVPPPGPTDYSPSADPTRDCPPIYSMGTRRPSLSNKAIDYPGPGAHQPRDRQVRGNDSQRATLKGRWRSTIEITPGPADYDAAWKPPRSLSDAQLARMGARKSVPERIKMVIEDTPGPADYNLKSMNFTKRAGPAYSLSARINSIKRDNVPGPNAYDAGPKRDAPKASMKSRMSPFVLMYPTSRVDTLRT
ncbi:uncharacterized protein BJ171DRAFT_641682 [Polychytrium aggregatum]|uniref:uncharacterized protein n=1 Tax=Polychytrium aggregatum TaxID=110093 RepID=UPI0022FE8EFC|nr:uncharacterized protein BJ171DRAFT_641682 [Polychytrium aggregatum]KAI9206877.1 hypothetical protein BJ171DRAFT_641682 [Polychytrium aggregatum]